MCDPNGQMSGPSALPPWMRVPLLCLVITITVLLPSCQASRQQIYGDKPGPKGFGTVVIDAGHGGRDSGARARGHLEKNLTLDLANRMRRELQPGFKVVMLRDRDEFLDLDERVHQANRHRDAVLLSLHFNYGPRRLAGPETYYWRVDSYSLAKRLQQKMAAVVPGNRGNRGLVRRRLRLTRNPEIPCVLLECGYLTNAREASLLRSPAYLDRLASALAEAVREQARRGDEGMGPLPRPIFAPPSKGTDARDQF